MAVITRIKSLEMWEEYGGPKRPEQWADGRSAKECARAWLAGGNSMPGEVARALTSHPGFGEVLEWWAEPEVRLAFDKYRGEPRNTDLAVRIRDRHGWYFLAVEAKADESFGATVAKTIQAAEARLTGGVPGSKGVERVQGLADALFGSAAAQQPWLADLRYQLLTATAGALAETARQGCSRAVLLIHEFVTCATVDERHEANAQDLDAFVCRLTSGSVGTIVSGALYGPIRVLGYQPDLYIGKARRELR